MDKVKEPAMALSLINSTALVGSMYYIYQKILKIEADQGEIVKSVQHLSQKLGKYEKSSTHKDEEIKDIRKDLDTILESVDNYALREEVENMDRDLDAFVTQLTDNESLKIELERPSQEYKAKPKSYKYKVKVPQRSKTQDKRTKPYKDEDEEAISLVTGGRLAKH